jgi:hypothetical protein
VIADGYRGDPFPDRFDDAPCFVAEDAREEAWGGEEMWKRKGWRGGGV